jgi:MarR family transcriptional regulator, temperature-dependent positive regulator of motility
MSRDALVEDLYRQLNALIRRSRELGNDLHPGLSLVGYTFLSMVETTPEIRAADLADVLSLDKSIVSRQLNQLFDAGLLDREGGRPGRRGDPLSLTAAGRRALATDAKRVRRQLTHWIEDWKDGDVAALAHLMSRFNASVAESLAS